MTRFRPETLHRQTHVASDGCGRPYSRCNVDHMDWTWPATLVAHMVEPRATMSANGQCN